MHPPDRDARTPPPDDPMPAPGPTDSDDPVEGLVPPMIAEDPEHDRVVDPAETPPWPNLALPHERDESPDATAAQPDPVIEQAARDLDAGLVDTDMRATPGLDAARRARLVPTPKGPR